MYVCICKQVSKRERHKGDSMGNSANAQEMVSERSLVQCKRCGAERLVWVKSAVTGKFFLCPTVNRTLWCAEGGDNSLPRGYVTAVKMRPHRCGEAEAKAAKRQAEIDDYNHNENMKDP